MSESGWRPLRRPSQIRRAAGAEGFNVTPFMRLARVHAATTASDAAVAVTLAGSIFFSISPSESRWRVALYLVVTMAPFVVVTPLIGPAMDRIRGGRRLMIVITVLVRAAVAFMIIRQFDSLLLFPLALGLLVMQKSYAVAKTALVPDLAESGDLVKLNSRLALISGLSSVVGAVLSGAVALLFGPAGSAVVATIGFSVAFVLALKLPSSVVASAPPADLERVELRDRAVILGASAMAMLRGVSGFVAFLLAFELRGGSDGLDVGKFGAAVGGATATIRDIDITGDPSAPAWHFGVVLAAAGAGSLLGARFAPNLRERFDEERMLQGVLMAILVAGAFAAFSGSLSGAALMSFTVAISAGIGKLAFDSLVQRVAPDANYGRTFSKFEARFQVAWVVGAFVPVVIPLNTQIGGLAVASVGGLAFVSYLVGRPVGAVVKSGVRTGVRNSRLVRSSFGRRPASPVPSESGGGTANVAEVDVAEVDQMPDEELRPSQPQPPDVTQWEPAKGWTPTSGPYVSSVDGVEVDPAKPVSESPPSGGEIDSGQP